MEHRTQHSKPTITHPNGLSFTVIPANSYDARVVARDRRQLVMTDGNTWNVGTLGYSSAFAWRTEEPAVTDRTHPAQQRQLQHALTALARTTPGRRRYIAAAAAEYLAQVDRRRLPLGYDRPILIDWSNRADAFRMRRGCTVAAMLGLAVEPHDEHFPTIARAIVTAVDAPVDCLVQAARTTGAPAAVALVHLLGGVR